MGSDDEVGVNRDLAMLEDVSTGTRPWLEPAELRRRARNRRLRRRGGVIGAGLAVVVLLATLVPIGFGGRTPPNTSLHVVARFGPAIQLVSHTAPGEPVPARPYNSYPTLRLGNQSRLTRPQTPSPSLSSSSRCRC